VISYIVSGADPAMQQVIQEFDDLETLDATRGLHLVVSCDPADAQAPRIPTRDPGRIPIADFDLRFGRALGIVDPNATGDTQVRPVSFVLGPDLRVLHTVPITGPGHATRIRQLLPSPDPPLDRLMGGFAPVLVLPRVLEPELCEALIDYYDRSDAQPTGVVVNNPDGSGRVQVDASRKTRRDVMIRDRKLVATIHDRIKRRIVPEIFKAFHFRVAHVERYVLACYLARERGWFAPHRDNQGKNTAHRKFACTLNLNAQDYDGGDLYFPEFGERRYRAPSGGAVVFSCSLLHAVDPVTRGRRLAVLPFLYDEAGMKVREQNYAAAAR